jgi:hypothetical protein
MSYPTTPLKTFADVQNLLDAFLATAQFPIGGAPHKQFWRTNAVTGQAMTWEAFTTGVLPLLPPDDVNYQDPSGNTDSPLILVVGHADESPIINMLSASGTYWNDVGQNAGQMPAGGNAPYDPNPPFDPPQALVIQLLSDWINNGCPNGIHSLVRKEA